MTTPKKARRSAKRSIARLGKAKEDEPISLRTKLFVFLILAMFVGSLAMCGGNSNKWYPGKPINLR